MMSQEPDVIACVLSSAPHMRTASISQQDNVIFLGDL